MLKLKESILKKLEEIYNELDHIQEDSDVQANTELMWDIGEAMASVDNAIDIIIFN